MVDRVVAVFTLLQLLYPALLSAYPFTDFGLGVLSDPLPSWNNSHWFQELLSSS